MLMRPFRRDGSVPWAARRVMMRPASVGGWLVVRLRSPLMMASAIDYLEIVSRESAAADEATGVVEAIARVEGLPTTMLKLPEHLAERAASTAGAAAAGAAPRRLASAIAPSARPCECARASCRCSSVSSSTSTGGICTNSRSSDKWKEMSQQLTRKAADPCAS